MSIENFMGMFKNNSENAESEKLQKGKDVMTNLFNNPDEIKNRLDKFNQQA